MPNPFAFQVATGLLLLGLMAPMGSQASQLLGLGFHPDGSSSISYAQGVSDDGTVVVGLVTSETTRSDAFRWTLAGGMQLLDDGGGTTSSAAFAVSADGSRTAGTRDDSFNSDYGVVWSASGVATPLFPFEQPDNGLISWEARSVSADGTVVGGHAYSDQASPPFSGNEAFRWTEAEGAVGLGVLPGAAQYRSRGGYLSADGSVSVGGSFSANGFEAFRWTSATGMTGLGDLAGGGFYSEAFGISPDGGTVVGVATGAAGPEAMRWTATEGLVGLGNLPTVGNCRGLGASMNGAIIVGFCESSLFEGTAFIWTEAGGMQGLLDYLVAIGATGLTDWTSLEAAAAISADGQFLVGNGIRSSGQREAFLVQLTPVPAPPGLLLLATGVAALAWRRRR